MLLDARICALIVGLAAHASCGAEPRTAPPGHVGASAAAAAATAGARSEPRRSVAASEEREGRAPAAGHRRLRGPPTVLEPWDVNTTSSQRGGAGAEARGDGDVHAGGRRRLSSSDDERRVPVVDRVARSDPHPYLGKVFATTVISEEGERRNEDWRRTVDRWKGDPSGFQMEIARRNSRRRFAVAERHNLRPHALREAAGRRKTSRDSRWGK